MSASFDTPAMLGINLDWPMIVVPAFLDSDPPLKIYDELLL